MKREIKFRAWHKGVKIMQLVVNLDWSTIGDRKIDGLWSIEGIDIVKTRSSGGSTKFVRQEDYVLMQFTGLLDKNGKEIYEGDIVKDGEYKHQIIHSEKNLGFMLEEIKNGTLRDFYPYDIDYEVIGNIYENPELNKPLLI